MKVEFDWVLGEGVTADRGKVSGVVEGLYISRAGVKTVYVEYYDTLGVRHGQYFYENDVKHSRTEGE